MNPSSALFNAKTIGLATLLYGCAATGFADYVTLRESDVDGSAAQGEASYMSSFLTNPTEEGYGWSDGGDPDPNKDYRVSGKILRTPCRESDSLSTTTFTFPGRSLRVSGSGSIVFRSSWGAASNYATVRIDDLTLCKGKLDNGSWARPTCWDGKITIDSSEYNYAKNAVSFSINMSTCYFPAKMVASVHESVLLGGTSATSESSGTYRWVSNFEGYRYRFEGDCTEYFATNNCGWGVQAKVATPDFAGSFNLGNASAVTVEGIPSAVIRGAIVSRDGTIRVPEAASLDVRGGIDSAFADFETHVSGGIDVYTRLSSSEPYTNSNYVTGGSSTKRVPINAILLETDSALSAADANLDGTLVQIPSGATLTIGDAALKDVTLDIAAGGKLALTNSFTATTPVKLRLSGTGSKTAFITLPVDKGELRAEDFTFEGAPQFRFSASVETTEGIQTLWITDINPDIKDETTGYVVQVKADGSDSSYTIGSYNMAGNWSEADMAPHPNTNYYTTVHFRDKSALSKTFAGDSLTLASVFRLARTTYEIKDWRVVSNGKTAIDQRTGLTTAGNKNAFTFEGQLTVFATSGSPFTLYGGLAPQKYVMNMKIRGAADAAISLDGALSRSPGEAAAQVSCEFPGDMSEYYGTLFVGTNETVRLGKWGLTNGTLVVRTPYATVGTTSDVGAFVPVRRYVMQASTTVDVPDGTELAVTDSADITGTLTKAGNGRLSFGGEALAGEGAALNVAAGSFGVKSMDAVNGIPVTFGDGSRLIVDIEAAGDLGDFGVRNVESDTPFAAAGGGSIRVAFTGALPGEAAKIAICTISSTATAPTFALPSRFAQFKVSSAEWRVNDDGSRTFEVMFGKPGCYISIR